MEQLALRRRDLDSWQASRLAGVDGDLQRRVVRRQQPGHVLIELPTSAPA